MVCKALISCVKINEVYLRTYRLLPAFRKECFCSDSKSGNEVPTESFREKLIKKHFHPSELQVEHLQRQFPDPKKIIDDFFAPFKQLEANHIPKLEVRTHLKGNIYKTTLMFFWPRTLGVDAAHNHEDSAVLNAYLNACKLFWDMGLLRLSDNGVEVHSSTNVINMLEELASYQSGTFGCDSYNFRIINLLQHSQDEKVTWDSSVQVFWPLKFTVNSKSRSLDLAYYKSCLKAAMRFKASGYLDTGNNLKKGILLSLLRLQVGIDHNESPFVTRTTSDPDFEMFIDASAHGMGAYLISRDSEKVRWFSDRWVNTDRRIDTNTSSDLTEFYTVVTAFYTWKHKFAGKKVICFSDNAWVVNALNHGLYLTQLKKKGQHYSLFLLLMSICHKYRITLIGVHVPRENNEAADHLSKCNIEEFKKIVPTAYERPKKLKKLLFCKIERNCERHKKSDKNKHDEDPEKTS